MPQVALPPGYDHLDSGPLRLTVAKELHDLLLPHLQDDFAALSGMNRLRPFPGTPHALLFWIDSPPRYFVLRRSRRRGLIGRVLRDLYGDPERPLRELIASEKARRGGVPTPRVVAVRTAKGPAGFWRHAVVTEAVPNAEPLDQAVTAAGRLTGPARRKRLEAIGEPLAAAISALHEAGVLHADLQTENILVSVTNAIPPVHLIDLDGAEVVEHAVPAARLANLQRLHRSCVKRGLAPAPLSASARIRFFRLYQRTVPILTKKGERKKEWSRWEAALFFHRLWWSLTGGRKT